MTPTKMKPHPDAQQASFAPAPCYAPTAHLRWRDADMDEESGPCGTNLRAWPEMGRSGWVLEQYWTNGKIGEWRSVEQGDGKEPPQAPNDES